MISFCRTVRNVSELSSARPHLEMTVPRRTPARRRASGISTGSARGGATAAGRASRWQGSGSSPRPWKSGAIPRRFANCAGPRGRAGGPPLPWPDGNGSVNRPLCDLDHGRARPRCQKDPHETPRSWPPSLAFFACAEPRATRASSADAISHSKVKLPIADECRDVLAPLALGLAEGAVGLDYAKSVTVSLTSATDTRLYTVTAAGDSRTRRASRSSSTTTAPRSASSSPP